MQMNESSTMTISNSDIKRQDSEEEKKPNLFPGEKCRLPGNENYSVKFG